MAEHLGEMRIAAASFSFDVATQLMRNMRCLLLKPVLSNTAVRCICVAGIGRWSACKRNCCRNNAKCRNTEMLLVYVQRKTGGSAVAGSPHARVAAAAAGALSAAAATCGPTLEPHLDRFVTALFGATVSPKQEVAEAACKALDGGFLSSNLIPVQQTTWLLTL